jgi:hypothetical protein
MTQVSELVQELEKDVLYLRGEVKRLEDELEVAKDCIDFMSDYFWTELHWERFRDEFLRKPASESDNKPIHKSNAHILAEFMKDIQLKYPSLAAQFKFRG